MKMTPTGGLTLESLIYERDFLRSAISTAWLRHRPAEKTGGSLGISAAPRNIEDSDLVHRITSAFRKANGTSVDSTGSFWLGPIADIRKTEDRTMLEGSHADITKMLRDPRLTSLFYGFDNLVANSPDNFAWQDWIRQWTYDCLVRLAEAVGSIRLELPEAPQQEFKIRDVEDLLTGLDDAFGFKILFPNVFAEEVGLQTARGVASFRAIQGALPSVSYFFRSSAAKHPRQRSWRSAPVLDARPISHVNLASKTIRSSTCH